MSSDYSVGLNHSLFCDCKSLQSIANLLAKLEQCRLACEHALLEWFALFAPLHHPAFCVCVYVCMYVCVYIALNSAGLHVSMRSWNGLRFSHHCHPTYVCTCMRVCMYVHMLMAYVCMYNILPKLNFIPLQNTSDREATSYVHMYPYTHTYICTKIHILPKFNFTPTAKHIRSRSHLHQFERSYFLSLHELIRRR
jgi:hypothetical protein